MTTLLYFAQHTGRIVQNVQTLNHSHYLRRHAKGVPFNAIHFVRALVSEIFRTNLALRNRNKNIVQKKREPQVRCKTPYPSECGNWPIKSCDATIRHVHFVQFWWILWIQLFERKPLSRSSIGTRYNVDISLRSFLAYKPHLAETNDRRNEARHGKGKQADWIHAYFECLRIVSTVLF